MRNFVKLILASLLVLAMAFALVGCSGQSQDNDQQDQAAAPETKKLVVGTNATFPPFEMQEGQELVGFDMDLIRAIGEAMGYEVEIKHMDFKALIPSIQSGKIDAAIAGMSITPERLESVNFTETYFDAGLIIAVHKDNQDIKSTEDLKGKKLAAQNGTIGAAYCDEVKKADASTEVRIFDDIGAAFMELERGGVDAVVNDHPVTAYYLKVNSDTNVKMVGDIFSADDQYGIAVKKDNTQLLNDLNEGLAKIKEDGTYDEIYSKWF
ncbi:MAG TPA: basic amino acid ABC transporter substrate-binding protein [Syntrophomonadaceae bacterium]|nr:basic amino acid ABC transporter substrate-binding protein [Syntrophomonadaceae bacterium]HPU47740.1 basic amino acid ABC transporter substrate-binding protein [Syntrophomonadaceae bacterium]